MQKRKRLDRVSEEFTYKLRNYFNAKHNEDFESGTTPLTRNIHLWLNEYMALPSLLRGKHPSEIKKFLALDIGLEVVTAGLWSVQDGKAHVISSSSPIEWRDERLDELAEASDVALEELGADATKIDEVLLGLPEEWVQNDQIVPEKRPLLKAVKDELSLKPMGFVVTREAVLHYLQELEGGPLTALLIEFTSTQIAVSSVKAGKKGETSTVGRSGDSISDITEALSRLRLDSYPARMVVYSVRLKQEELEIEKQKILANDWQKQFAFMHTPKVEVLPHILAMTAVCSAGGSVYAKTVGELGQTVIPQHVDHTPSQKKKDAHVDVPQHQKSEESESNIQVPQEEPSNFGFEELTQQTSTPTDTRDELPDAEQPSMPANRKNPILSIQRGIKNSITTLFAGRSLKSRFSAEVSGAKTMRIIAVLVLFVLVVFGGVGWWMLDKAWSASILISLKTEPITTKVELTLDANASQTDADKGILKVSKVTEEVSGQLEGETTGTKIVGDRAKGKVTIYNATSGEKTFKAGTVLSGPRGLNMTLDNDVTVASSSGSSLLNTQWGNASADVTATNIGQESNLPPKTEFMVANFDKKSYVASNEESFTGGTSREIQAVSKEDQARLERLLSKSLQQQAIEAIKAKQQSGRQLVSVGEPTVKEKIYSAKIGEEARNITLQMKVTAQALEYVTSDLLPIAQQRLQELIPDGALLLEEKTTIDPQDIVASSSATVQLRALLSSERILPVDKKFLADQVKGVTIAQATSLLKERTNIASSDVVIEPFLAKLIFGKLPMNVDQITIQTRISQ